MAMAIWNFDTKSFTYSMKLQLSFLALNHIKKFIDTWILLPAELIWNKNDRRTSGGTLRQGFNLIGFWHLTFHQRTNGPMVPWSHSLIVQWSIGLMDQWTNEPMDQWTNGTMDQCSTGPTDRWTSGPMDQWTDGTMDQLNNGPLDQWNNGPMYQW